MTRRNLERLAGKAAQRRAEIAAVTAPNFVTDPRDARWQVDYDTGLAHLFTDVYFLDSKSRLWIAPSCGCGDERCRLERALLAGKFQQTGTGRPSDGSSIPRLAWIFTDSAMAPENAIPGFLHDHAYRTRRLADGTSITRKDADQMYREACPFHPEISREAATLRYYALRIGAWLAWAKHRRNEPREVTNG